MSRLSFIDLFAGAGGWTLAMEAAGLNHLRMYDHNQSACTTALANFGDVVDCVDLSRHATIDFPDADIVVGSPPCQGFSNEGKKNPDDARNTLVWSFLDIIDRVRPKAWVFENVPGFQSSYRGRWFKDLSARLDASEYQWTHCVLNAADYGVPQYRKRFFVLAGRGFRPKPPGPTHAVRSSLFGEVPQIGLWDAISDLPEPIQGDRDGTFDYESPANTDYQVLMRTGAQRLYNHTAQRHSRRVLEKIMAVPVGGDMLSFLDQYEENAVHYMGGYRRAPKARPSWTAYWTRGMTSIHPEQHRFLTPRECARLQSFPDRFRFCGTTIENYTQVCNAVPPLLAQAIATVLRAQIQSAYGAGVDE